MFDFEKLDVYKKAKAFNASIRQFIDEMKLDPTTKDQLRRASFSVVLNLAEVQEGSAMQIEGGFM